MINQCCTTTELTSLQLNICTRAVPPRTDMLCDCLTWKWHWYTSWRDWRHLDICCWSPHVVEGHPARTPGHRLSAGSLRGLDIHVLASRYVQLCRAAYRHGWLWPGSTDSMCTQWTENALNTDNTLYLAPTENTLYSQSKDNTFYLLSTDKRCTWRK